MIAPSGMQAAMARIETMRNMAASLGGGFAGTLGTAMSTVSATSASVVSSPAVAMPTAPTTTSTENAAPPARSSRWRTSIDRAATAAGIEPELLTALVWTESGFEPDAVSSAGAIGLTQLMPATAEGLGVDPYDPDQNLAGGARFLAAMIDRFGSVDMALAAYNAGPGRVAALDDGSGRVPVSQDYVNTVLARYHSLGGTA